jgi:hypothetical protein
VTVRGTAFGSQPVEIRWNTLDGPKLATVQGPDISANITIPPSADGLYSILAFERRPDGSVGSSGRAAFQVTSTGGPTPVASPQGATSTTNGPSGTQTQKSSSGLSTGVATFGGAVLLVAGLIVGSLLGRRRDGTPPSSTG